MLVFQDCDPFDRVPEWKIRRGRGGFITVMKFVASRMNIRTCTWGSARPTLASSRRRTQLLFNRWDVEHSENAQSDFVWSHAMSGLMRRRLRWIGKEKEVALASIAKGTWLDCLKGTKIVENVRYYLMKEGNPSKLMYHTLNWSHSRGKNHLGAVAVTCYQYIPQECNNLYAYGVKSGITMRIWQAKNWESKFSPWLPSYPITRLEVPAA